MRKCEQNPSDSNRDSIEACELRPEITQKSQKMQFVWKLVLSEWWVGKSLRSTLERHKNDFWSLLGFFILGRLGTQNKDTQKQDKIWNFGAKFTTSQIRISKHFRHQSAAIFLKNLKIAIRICGEWVSHVRMPKNRVFCIDSRPPLYFPISAPRRGASHHFPVQRYYS